MNSSITSLSCSTRTELKVVVLLLAVLAANEVVMRIISHSVSKDVAHIEQFEEIANTFHDHQPEAESSVLFIGNSLTRYGINNKLMHDRLEELTHKTVEVAKICPDNTSLPEWYYAYMNHFEHKHILPQTLVLGFAEIHLIDQRSNAPDRLAYYYCGIKNAPDLLRWDLPDAESLLHHMIAAESAVLSNRDRIQKRVMSSLIPQYQEGIQQLNQRLVSKQPSSLQIDPADHYQRLRHLIHLAQEDEINVTLVAMPINKEYEIDPQLLQLTNAEHVKLIDCRHVPGLKSQNFFDGLHLDETGGRLLTEYLVRQIVSAQISPPLLP